MLYALIALVVLLSLPVVVVLLLTKRRALFPADEKQPVVFPILLPYTLIGVVLAFNLFGFPLNIGIGLGIFGALVQAGIVVAMNKRQRTPAILFLAVCGMIASVMLGIRGNDFLLELNTVSAIIVTLLLFLAQSVDAIRWRGLWLIKMVGRYLSGVLDHIPHVLRLSKNMKNSQGGVLISVLKTVVLTFIALFFFSVLLSQADAVFKHVIDEISKEVVPRFGYSLLITVVLTIVLTMKFIVPDSEESHAFRFLKFHELFFPTVSIVVLFAIFLVIQAKYLFGSHENIQLYNITYSDYVRKGFIELLTASFFGGLLSYIVNLRTLSMDTLTRKRELKIVNVILIAELCLMLASALKRDYLYMDTYGITRVRIIGEVFVWWLAGLFVLLFAFAVYKRMREEQFFAGIGILSALAVLSLNGMNMDAKIAAATPPHNRQKDLYYISLLSTDASSEWKAMILDAQKRYQSLLEKNVINDATKVELASILASMKNMRQRVADLDALNNPPIKWQEKNSSKSQALAITQANPKLYKDLPSCLIDDIHVYQVRHQIDLQNEIIAIKYDASYPFIFDAPKLPYEADDLYSLNSNYYSLVPGTQPPEDDRGRVLPPSLKNVPQVTGCKDIVVR